MLATFAREAETRGVSVVALAPTASAAMVLGEALGARSDTVARHLLSPERPSSGQPAAWIVDEASLLSARDTARLFDLAEKQNARVILVGDVKQLGSVEAGAAFAQLQGAGMEVAKLGEIVRQTNAATKDAVLASIEGDAKKALVALDRGGGRIVENADRAERFAAIAEHYAKLDKATRNDREAGRINGARGEVTAIDAQVRTAEIRNPRGQTQTLSLDAARDQHITHAYVDTAFAAQGRTADHVMIHADSKATNLIDQKSFYVGISRAKESVAIYTNDRGKLVSAINERAGQVQTAIAEVAMPTPSAGKAMGAGLG